MEKIKLLLYCTKQPLFLVRNEYDGYFYTMDKGTLNDYKNVETYNGKIVAECDYEVEEIYYLSWMNEELRKRIYKESCLNDEQLSNYMDGHDTMYAIHIKNLHIFDEPRELWRYETKGIRGIKNAPQNMMYAYGIFGSEKYILISIRPEWLCKILNGEKTIEVRKKVLKEMLE